MSDYNDEETKLAPAAFVIGDRVQLTYKDEGVSVGEIVSLETRIEEGETCTYAQVQWDHEDDGVLDEVDVELLEVEEDEDELEAEFRKVAEAHMDEIDEQVEIAQKALRMAVKLSEKYGLPFYAGVSPLGQSYCPNSLQDIFGDLSSGIIHDVTGVYSISDEGWEHSAVC